MGACLRLHYCSGQPLLQRKRGVAKMMHPGNQPCLFGLRRVCQHRRLVRTSSAWGDNNLIICGRDVMCGLSLPEQLTPSALCRFNIIEGHAESRQCACANTFRATAKCGKKKGELTWNFFRTFVFCRRPAPARALPELHHQATWHAYYPPKSRVHISLSRCACPTGVASIRFISSRPIPSHPIQPAVARRSNTSNIAQGRHRRPVFICRIYLKLTRVFASWGT